MCITAIFKIKKVSHLFTFIASAEKLILKHIFLRFTYVILWQVMLHTRQVIASYEDSGVT